MDTLKIIFNSLTCGKFLLTEPRTKDFYPNFYPMKNHNEDSIYNFLNQFKIKAPKEKQNRESFQKGNRNGRSDLQT